MIALDTNILVHGIVKTQQKHRQVKAWLEKNTEPLATTLTNIAEVLRLVTHPKIFSKSLNLKQAIGVVDDFLGFWNIVTLHESSLWPDELKKLAQKVPDTRGNAIHDARVALCLKHHDVPTICTFDRDFLRFGFLKVVAP